MLGGLEGIEAPTSEARTPLPHTHKKTSSTKAPASANGTSLNRPDAHAPAHEARPAKTAPDRRMASMNFWKRALDLAIAAPVLLFVSPLMLGLAIAIRLQDRGPALFKHTRVGLGGRSFTCYKFRTMAMDAEERLKQLLETDANAAEEWCRDHKLRDDPRVLGAVGRFLRVTSLDELPQLFNIIKGDMSVVGPRPIVAAEIPKYRRYYYHYYTSVRPGVTGLWQVSGRNDVPYARRVRLDAAYARKWCLSLDLWILLRTLPAVIFQRGAY